MERMSFSLCLWFIYVFPLIMPNFLLALFLMQFCFSMSFQRLTSRLDHLCCVIYNPLILTKRQCLPHKKCMRSNGSLLITYQVRSHSLKCLLHFNFIRFLPLQLATFSLSVIGIIFNPTAGSLAKNTFLWLLFLQYQLNNRFYVQGFMETK